jgi:hypothetical protein
MPGNTLLNELQIGTDIKRARETLAGMVRWPLRREAQAVLKDIRDQAFGPALRLELRPAFA